MSNAWYDPSQRSAIASGFIQALNEIVIPTNATPNTFPRVEIGIKLPADLVAFYAGIGETAIGGMVLWGSSTEYTYAILAFDGAGTAKLVFGGRNAAFGVSEAQEIVPANGGSAATEIIAFGEHSNVQMEVFGTTTMFFFNTSTLQIQDSARVLVTTNATMQFQGTALSFINSGAHLEMVGPSFIQIDSGASIEVEPGGVINVDGSLVVSPNQPNAFIDVTNTGLVKFEWFGDLQMDPDGFTGLQSRGRGYLSAFTATGNFAGAAAFFPTCWQSPTKTYRKGRAFRVWIKATWSDNVANSQCLIELTNGIGTAIVGTYRTVPLPVVAGQEDLWHEFIFVNGSGADVSTGMQIRLTPANTVNVNGAGRGVIYMLIEDIGATGQFGSGASFPSF